MTTAFEPIKIGRLELKHRIAMAPMTRSRAYGPDQSPTATTAEYYAQRAGAALIVTEGTQPSVIGQGYPNTPGLHHKTQVEAWRKVTDAVHDQGGVIFAQLMHTGRIGHPANYRDGLTPVGPSAVRADGQIFTPKGLEDLVVPHEMTDGEIRQTIEDFAAAARNAIEAGFDGVELHGANGYLLQQFLATNANQRTDQWGGGPANRIRFTVEVVTAVAEAIGASRTGLRISPANLLNDIVEDDYAETYALLVDALNPLGLAYLHVMEAGAPEFTAVLRAAWTGVFMLNPNTPGSRTGADHLRLVEEGAADILSFGQLFIANPDLPHRLATGAPLTEADMSKAYGGDAAGYTDYPTHQPA
ncbi:alkene reductase [Streptomyces sp. NEAU-YJ-81]|uniref:alkene reductase n=1 Tax=Streptomyces sp. NEAU-YJ-81 TaxID=2820288 RepID=UPI001ABCB770|nr:alkene reductase [Streptomyces sp. NEAU-YJ-81]MBO3681998.1 alkene reductase [Streptomyces sp. NEAU-YJ-81]